MSEKERRIKFLIDYNVDQMTQFLVEDFNLDIASALDVIYSTISTASDGIIDYFLLDLVQEACLSQPPPASAWQMPSGRG